jgi:hypothetical protein
MNRKLTENKKSFIYSMNVAKPDQFSLNKRHFHGCISQIIDKSRHQSDKTRSH